jgi:ketosteroid isomerase-like protein
MNGRQEGLIDARFDTSELIDVPPDRVIHAARWRGRGRTSGLPTEAAGAAVWTLRDGLIAGVTLYETTADALEAAGLEE